MVALVLAALTGKSAALFEKAPKSLRALASPAA
jgi:hypothetical protein